MYFVINSQGIYKKANSIVEKFETRNSIELAQDLGILVEPVDYFKNLLGMYAYKQRVRAIFINDKMVEYLTQMVVAHEIGHDILHR